MTKLVLALVVSTLILISCQREIGFDEIQSANLLVKTVEKYGADSVVVEYFYDASNQLIRKKQTGVVAGSDRTEELVITRSSSGAITKTVEKAAYLAAAGIDSMLTVYFYNSSTNRYTYSIMDMSQSGVALHDSTVYDYDGNGRIIRDEHFQYVSIIPTVQRFKQDYIYTGSGNIDSAKSYIYNPLGGYAPSSYSSYQYDPRINPLQLKNEAILLYMVDFTGRNNVVMEKVNIVAPPSTSTTSSTFMYNADNLPVSADITRSAGNTSTKKYFYQ